MTDAERIAELEAEVERLRDALKNAKLEAKRYLLDGHESGVEWWSHGLFMISENCDRYLRTIILSRKISAETPAASQNVTEREGEK